MRQNISKLFKTEPIKGNFAHFYHIDIEDAEFILKLRTEERKDNYLMSTDKNLEKQKEYLISSRKKFLLEEEIYFKIYDLAKNKFSGFVRLTEIQSETNFGWESAVLDKSSSPNLFIDVMLMIYRIGFDFLGRDLCGPWKVKKGFQKMMKIHEIIGMVDIINENEDHYEISVQKEKYREKIDYYLARGLGSIQNLNIQ